jgi:hypothetical protein
MLWLASLAPSFPSLIAILWSRPTTKKSFPTT